MSVWTHACQLLARYLTTDRRLDHILEALPNQVTGDGRRRAIHLVYGVVRHRALLEAALQAQLRAKPRPLLYAALMIGAFELLEHPEKVAVIVHHAVAQTRGLTSPKEAGLVNAVLRRIPDRLGAILAANPSDAAGLARRYSHPEWLVERWLRNWGPDATKALLEWDQQPAEVFARASDIDPIDLPGEFRPTGWTGFFRLERPDWKKVDALLEAGKIYIQNPATALSVDLLAPREGEHVIDLCAAPGGKTLQLAKAVGPRGHVVAVDLPGPRLERLHTNLIRCGLSNVTVVAADAADPLPAALKNTGAVAGFGAVLADVPCSNTGVLRHRVDVKWRLRPDDIKDLIKLQLRILTTAAAAVRPGGRIVYSTCSLEPEENAGVVAQFLSGGGGAFQRLQAKRSFPPNSRCDGAEACLLRRG